MNRLLALALLACCGLSGLTACTFTPARVYVAPPQLTVPVPTVVLTPYRVF